MITNNNTARTFFYNAKRDIISTIIGSFITFIVFFIMKALFSWGIKMDGGNPGEIVLCRIVEWLYVIIALVTIAGCIWSTYSKTFNRLVIKTNEVVFRTGLLERSETSIPAHKIRSCKKASGPLQRACKTMDIVITTAGDDAEIVFHNIRNGKEAYRILTEMSNRNGYERRY